MRRAVIVMALVVGVAGCGGGDGSASAPSSPSPATPAAPVVTVASVQVTGPGCAGDACVGNAIPGGLQLRAQAVKSDSSTQDVTTEASWKSSSTAVASVSSSGLVTFHKPGSSDVTAVYSGKLGGVTINVNPALWSRAGAGDTVFDMPTYIARVRITADYGGSSSNFIVRIGGRLVVNELVGRSWGQPHFEGTYTTTGGVVEITHSSGVAWTFAEVR